MTDKIEPCLHCGSIHVEEIQQSESIEIGWEDGLGSPGTHTHKWTEIRCRSCGSTSPSKEIWSQRQTQWVSKEVIPSE